MSTPRPAVIRAPAATAISSRKPGTMAIVPPTLAPNPGQPAAMTATTATALIPATAGRREPRRSAADPSQPHSSRPDAA